MVKTVTAACLALALSQAQVIYIEEAGWHLRGATEEVNTSLLHNNACVYTVWSYQDGRWAHSSEEPHIVAKGFGFWIKTLTACTISSDIDAPPMPAF